MVMSTKNLREQDVFPKSKETERFRSLESGNVLKKRSANFPSRVSRIRVFNLKHLQLPFLFCSTTVEKTIMLSIILCHQSEVGSPKG